MIEHPYILCRGFLKFIPEASAELLLGFRMADASAALRMPKTRQQATPTYKDDPQLDYTDRLAALSEDARSIVTQALPINI